MAREDVPPHIRDKYAEDVNDLTQPEILYSYCLVAYLVEGRPEECVDFFRDVGTAKVVNPEAVSLKHFGLKLPALEARVERWLEETTR